MKALANLALPAPFKSAEEALWAEQSALELGRLGLVANLTEYEPLRFSVGGGWYTPDFLHILQDGRIVLVEVKGSRYQPSYRASRTKLKAAAEKFPYFYWLQATRDARGKEKVWRIEQIGAPLGKEN